jgi:hypothetical protein
LAVIANLLFVVALQLPTPDRDPRSFAIFLAAFFAAAILGFSLKFYSFIDAARRAQLDALVGKLRIRGCHVVCRYYDGELELGSDEGWLGREGFALRFEGAESRFIVTRQTMVAEPTNGELVVRVEGRPIRISVRAQNPRDRDDTEQLLRGWPASDDGVGVVLPPSTLQARSWDWYLVRAFESLAPGYWLAMILAWTIKIFVPESLTWLRWSLMTVPFGISLVAALLLARRLKRRDEALIAAFPLSSVPETVSMPETPATVSNAS